MPDIHPHSTTATAHDRGYVVTNARLNVRRGSATTAAPISRTVPVGTELDVQGSVQGQEVAGNATWYFNANNEYFWQGGCASLERYDDDEQDSDVQAYPVNQRRDGTTKPLKNAQRHAIFGHIPITPGTERGRIELPEGWAAEHTTLVQVPVLSDVAGGKIRMHKKAKEPFLNVFKAIEQAGIGSDLITYSGCFVPRHIGWNPDKILSSHSWGIAIDINAQWNGYGHPPAAPGQHGSVHRLLPYFLREGFAWGGHFKPASLADGMHFELARLDL